MVKFKTFSRSLQDCLAQENSRIIGDPQNWRDYLNNVKYLLERTDYYNPPMEKYKQIFENLRSKLNKEKIMLGEIPSLEEEYKLFREIRDNAIKGFAYNLLLEHCVNQVTLPKEFPNEILQDNWMNSLINNIVKLQNPELWQDVTPEKLNLYNSLDFDFIKISRKLNLA